MVWGVVMLYWVCVVVVGGGFKFEECYKGDEDVFMVELLCCLVYFFYVDGDDYVFMDDEDFF